jgi:hypothetical protein
MGRIERDICPWQARAETDSLVAYRLRRNGAADELHRQIS